jgi:hypothetical protein
VEVETVRFRITDDGFTRRDPAGPLEARVALRWKNRAAYEVRPGNTDTASLSDAQRRGGERRPTRFVRRANWCYNPLYASSGGRLSFALLSRIERLEKALTRVILDCGLPTAGGWQSQCKVAERSYLCLDGGGLAEA